MSILTGVCVPSAVKPTECVVLVNIEQIPNSVERYLEQTLCSYNTPVNKRGEFRFSETVAWRTEIFCVKSFSWSWKTEEELKAVSYLLCSYWLYVTIGWDASFLQLNTTILTTLQEIPWRLLEHVIEVVIGKPWKALDIYKPKTATVHAVLAYTKSQDLSNLFSKGYSTYAPLQKALVSKVEAEDSGFDSDSGHVTGCCVFKLLSDMHIFL